MLSNETGRFTSTDYDSVVFFGPPSPGVQEVYITLLYCYIAFVEYVDLFHRFSIDIEIDFMLIFITFYKYFIIPIIYNYKIK